jgi:phage terminase small subunit
VSETTSENITLLKPKHELACRKYVTNGGNKSQAYRDAGYSAKGAGGASQRLFARPDIKARIRELEADMRGEIEVDYGVTKDRLLAERARIAFFRTDMLYNADGTLKKPAEWGENVASVISSVKVFEKYTGTGNERKKVGEVVEVRTHSKTDCLLALEKIQGMYEMDNKQRNPYADMSTDELAKQIAEKEEKLKKVRRVK